MSAALKVLVSWCKHSYEFKHHYTLLSWIFLCSRVKALLAEAQGLELGEEHPLPWYPPVCATLTDIPEGPRSYDHIESVKDRTKIPLRLFDTAMKKVLAAL